MRLLRRSQRDAAERSLRETEPPAGLLVRARGVSKAYGALDALKEVDLDVLEGEVVALVGPNGAGKSTLLKTLVGLTLPSSGRAWIAGHPAGSVGAKSATGYLPQRVGFPEGMTVAEALRFFAGLREELAGSRARQAGASRAALETVGLFGLEERLVRELSGGMLQRLALAQALLSGPPVLVLDEPTLSLDSEGRRRLGAILQQVRGSRRCALVSSHVLDDALSSADRIVFLRAGRVVADERVAAIRARMRGRLYIRVEPVGRACEVLRGAGFGVAAANGEGLTIACEPARGADALRLLEEAGLSLAGFRTDQTSLDELISGYLAQGEIRGKGDDCREAS